MATKKVYYVAEGQQEVHTEASLLPYSSEQLADEAEAGEPRCSICHELLAWHEQVCSVAAPAVSASASVKSAAQSYAYSLGHLVQPVRQTQARTIIWRGQLKERHPQTGLVHRVNVYRLNDDFWDCYHEDDLQAA
jgi:hypothetical protein